jgi:hypothetical protein
VSDRFTEQSTVDVFLEFLISYEGTDPAVSEFCIQAALIGAQSGAVKWSDALKTARRGYRIGVAADSYARRMQNNPNNRLPLVSAREIMDSPHEFSRGLVHAASDKCRTEAAHNASALADVAVAQQWFSDGEPLKGKGLGARN